MTSAILAALLALPVYRHPAEQAESEDDRRARLAAVAEAIAAVARTPQEAAALIALGKHESGFALLVQAGRRDEMPEGQRCDTGRARGVWQLWEVACPSAYRHPAGSAESLRAEARCAVGNLRAAGRRCTRGGPEGTDAWWVAAFSGYAGAACETRWAPRRVATLREMERKLR